MLKVDLEALVNEYEELTGEQSEEIRRLKSERTRMAADVERLNQIIDIIGGRTYRRVGS